MQRQYGCLSIQERHRHRYEVNNQYRNTLEQAGLILSGLSPDGRLVEAVELADSPFFVGVQFHPELKSRPNRPHPLFLGLVEAALRGRHEKEGDQSMSHLREECGVFGMFSPQPCHAAHLTYYGLFALQHWGQESCGIVVNDDGVFHSRKDLGLLSEVFTKEELNSFPKGNLAVGHVRYGTTGGTSRRNCQPLEINHQKGKNGLGP